MLPFAAKWSLLLEQMKIKPQEPQQHESDFQNQKDTSTSTDSYFLMTLSALLTMEAQVFSHFSQAQAPL